MTDEIKKVTNNKDNTSLVIICSEGFTIIFYTVLLWTPQIDVNRKLASELCWLLSMTKRVEHKMALLP